MRRLLILLLTIILVLAFITPVLADSDWQAVKQDPHVGITVGTDNATSNMLFSISDPGGGNMYSASFVSNNTEGPWQKISFVSNDSGKTWQKIKFPQLPVQSHHEYDYKPYFYQGKLRVIVYDYHYYYDQSMSLREDLTKTETYETTDGSIWSIVNDPNKPYSLLLTQGELMALPDNGGMGIPIDYDIKEYFAVDDQTVLCIKNNGSLYRAVINGSKTPIDGVKASSLVASEPNSSGIRVVAAVKYQPLLISISKDRACTWRDINCEKVGKVFGGNKNLKVYLNNNGYICITDLAKTALISNDNGMSWKDIEMPKLKDRNVGEGIQMMYDNGTVIVFYTTKSNTYRYEYTLESKANLNLTPDNKAEATSPTTNQPMKSVTLCLQVGSKIMNVNGQMHTMDTPPLNISGRTMLPVKFVAAPLGATINWDATEKKTTIQMNGKIIELWTGKNIAKVNGTQVTIDPTDNNVKPYVVPPGRTMLPLRFIAENLGCDVQWDAKTKQITITNKQTAPTKS